MNKIKLSDAKCTELSFDAAVNMAKDEVGELKGFDLLGYTGAIVDRWWGKLIVNLPGISAKQNMPVFKNHNHEKIVGYSTRTSVDSSF